MFIDTILGEGVNFSDLQLCPSKSDAQGLLVIGAGNLGQEQDSQSDSTGPGLIEEYLKENDRDIINMASKDPRMRLISKYQHAIHSEVLIHGRELNNPDTAVSYIPRSDVVLLLVSLMVKHLIISERRISFTTLSLMTI